jgi:hypothetical protein
MADRVCEVKDPLTGESLFWAYEAGSTEAGGYDSYEEAEIAYTEAKHRSSETANAVKRALESTGTSHGHRHKKF